MTLANKITILRILLIPVFVWVLIRYINDFNAGIAHEWQRYLAFVIFTVASLSDALDGYVARRFNQKSELGTYLDPLADKGLLITTMILLARPSGGAFEQLPLWFPVLVISRDVLILVGTTLIHIVIGKRLPRARVVGKCATFFQMVTLGWVMLKITYPPLDWPLYAAGAFTLVSGIWYTCDGIGILGEHDKPDNGAAA